MTRIERFVNQLTQIGRENRNNVRVAQQKIQYTLTISLDESYNKGLCFNLFQLPEYGQILQLCRQLNYKIYRNPQGKHQLKFVSQTKSYYA